MPRGAQREAVRSGRQRVVTRRHGGRGSRGAQIRRWIRLEALQRHGGRRRHDVQREGPGRDERGASLAAQIMPRECARERAHAVREAHLACVQQVLGERVTQLVLGARPRSIEHEGRVEGFLGLLVGDVRLTLLDAGVSPKRFAAIGIEPVERLERPLPQVADLGGVDARRLHALTGCVERGRDAPVDLGASLRDDLAGHERDSRAPRPRRRRRRASAGAASTGSSSSAASSASIDGERASRLERQPAQQRAPDPARHAAVLRGRRRTRRSMTLSASATTVSPSNGRLPVQRLVERDAEAELIACGRRAACPRNCSGAMYAGVPTSTPVWVSGSSGCPRRAQRRARRAARRRVGVGGAATRRGVDSLRRVASDALARPCDPAWRARPKSMTRARPVGVEQHVVGLEVAVDEPGGVRGREPAPRRDEDVNTSRHGRGAACEPLAQRAAVDELHREEHALVDDADVVDDDDVRVRERAIACASRTSRACARGVRASRLAAAGA